MTLVPVGQKSFLALVILKACNIPLLEEDTLLVKLNEIQVVFPWNLVSWNKGLEGIIAPTLHAWPNVRCVRCLFIGPPPPGRILSELFRLSEIVTFAQGTLPSNSCRSL